MAIQGRNPYYRSEQLAVQGHHASEEDFWHLFKDDFCRPGRISFTMPPTHRMRLKYGKYFNYQTMSYNDMGTSQDLINLYNAKLAQGKVVAQGMGYEATRWGYSWPEQIKETAAQEESRGLSMEPFLNLLLKPVTERPSNIRECINFFYPLSGSVPPSPEISPFVSTSIAAYYLPNASPNETGSIPLQLGEVSMMYGWYLVWKMILCPSEFAENIAIFSSQESSNPRFPFTLVGDAFQIDQPLADATMVQGNQDADLLATISSAIRGVSQIAEAAAVSGVGLPQSLEDIKTVAAEALGIDRKNFVNELIHKYGTAYVASTLAKYVDIPNVYINDLATAVINGAMSPEKWDNLKKAGDRASTAALNLARNYVESAVRQNFQSLGVAGSQQYVSLLEDYMMTGIPKQSLLNRIEQIRQQIANNQSIPAADLAFYRTYTEKSRQLEKRSERLFADYVQYGNARPNPEPITLTLIGVSLVGKLIAGGVDYANAQGVNNVNSALQYLRSSVFRLNPNLQTGEVSFDLGSHIRKGVWEQNTWSENDWMSAALRPDCRLQQGGQVLDYWIHVWSRAQRIIRMFKSDRETYAERVVLQGTGQDAIAQTAALLAEKNRVFNYAKYFNGVNPVYQGNDPHGNRPRKDTYAYEENSVSQGHTRCQGLGILAKHTDSSMRKVLDSMGIFSPFTHAYGFAPTIQQLANNDYIRIDGVAPRRFLGHSNLIPAWKDSSDRFKASAAPGRLFPPNRIDYYNAYGQFGVECWARQAPLPSRRLLESVYGQRCNISFDVGLDPTSPVMDAQFCGLMAVLLSHPEALKTCSEMGIPWAKSISSRKWAFENRTLLASLALPKLKFDPRLITSRLSPDQRRILVDGVPLSPSGDIQVSKNVADAMRRLSLHNLSSSAYTDISSLPTSDIVKGAAITLTFASFLGYTAYKVFKS